MVEGISVKTTGPIFDGRASAAGKELAKAVTEAVAAFALEAVQRNLDASIRRPTPYYETQINIATTALTERRVNDRGVVYGPWLEGTSSRNQSTRFKGYASFRKAHTATVSAVDSIISGPVRVAVAKMGGTG